MSVVLQQTEGIQNATNSFASETVAGDAVVLGVFVIAVAFVLVFSTRAYVWALRSASAFATSLEYAIKGCATAVVLAIFASPLYLLSQTTPDQRRLVAIAAGLVVVGYVALVIMGLVGEQVWKQLAKRHEEATGHRPFENWGADDGEEAESA